MLARLDHREKPHSKPKAALMEGTQPDFNTNFAFTPGKLTITLDGGAGSSGKGKLGSFLCAHSDIWSFACNTFMPQAAHWVRLDDGSSFLYKTFNSCASQFERYDKLYIAPGATIELEAFWKEIEENQIPRKKIGISGLTSVLQGIDKDYELGLCDLTGEKLAEPVVGGPLLATGTTASGCGANRARRVLRHKTAKYAREVPELQEFLCDVPDEIMGRLDHGEAGLLEVAQGFQLSYMGEFFPHTTSRNCTVAAGLDDLMIPPLYAGNVVLNFRTYPIRINSDKYVDAETKNHLTQEEILARLETDKPLDELQMEEMRKAGIKLKKGNSGHSYSDQRELSWEDITSRSGSPEPLVELTSATGLPRRVYTFSPSNLAEAIRHNRTNGHMFLSVNFADYLDHNLRGVRSRGLDGVEHASKLNSWIDENFGKHKDLLRFIGTGAKSDDMILLG